MYTYVHEQTASLYAYEAICKFFVFYERFVAMGISCTYDYNAPLFTFHQSFSLATSPALNTCGNPANRKKTLKNGLEKPLETKWQIGLLIIVQVKCKNNTTGYLKSRWKRMQRYKACFYVPMKKASLEDLPGFFPSSTLPHPEQGPRTMCMLLAT